MLPTRPNTPLIYAHRGSSVLAPENTQLAFDLALANQSDVLETDVRITADQQIMVIHDATVDRTTDGRGKVKDLTLDQLKKLDAGYTARGIHGESFRNAGTTLLTLDELFQIYPETAINIDIKDNDPGAAQLVADTILRHRRVDNTVVGSFHPKVLLRFRLIAPLVKTAAVQQEVAQLFLQHLPLPKFKQAMIKKAKTAADIKLPMNYSAVQIPVSWRMIPLGTARFIQHVQNHNKEICYWTVNNPSVMRRLLAQGADGIITDRPDLALQVFREFGFK